MLSAFANFVSRGQGEKYIRSTSYCNVWRNRINVQKFVVLRKNHFVRIYLIWYTEKYTFIQKNTLSLYLDRDIHVNVNFSKSEKSLSEKMPFMTDSYELLTFLLSAFLFRRAFVYLRIRVFKHEYETGVQEITPG